MIGLSVPVFAALIIAALYVPENFFLHSTKSSGLEGWMLDQSQLPADMLLVGESIDDNADIANNYPDTKEMLKRLEAFGRKVGFSREYAARERCRQPAPRWISTNLVSHELASGAQDYWQWLRERDRADAEQYQEVPVGEGGYMLWSTVDSTCAVGEKEYLLEISFHRNQLLATVRLRVGSAQNRLEDVLPLGLTLVKTWDERLLGSDAVK